MLVPVGRPAPSRSARRPRSLSRAGARVTMPFAQKPSPLPKSPQSARSKHPLWGDRHSPPSFMTGMSFISAPSASTRGHCPTSPRGSGAHGQALTPPVPCTVALVGEGPQPAGRPRRLGSNWSSWSQRPALHQGKLPGTSAHRKKREAWPWAPSKRVAARGGRRAEVGGSCPVRGLRSRGLCWARTSGATAHLTSRLTSVCASLSCDPATQDPFE